MVRSHGQGPATSVSASDPRGLPVQYLLDTSKNISETPGTGRMQLVSHSQGSISRIFYNVYFFPTIIPRSAVKPLAIDR